MSYMLPTTEETLTTLILSNGNIPLAAERLHIPLSTLLSILNQDTSLLTSYLHTFSQITAFSLLGQVKIVVESTLHSLEPKDAAKFMSSLLSIIGSTPTPTSQVNQINVFDSVLKILPPEAKQALLTLTQQQQ